MRCFYCNQPSAKAVCTPCAAEQEREHAKSVWSRSCQKTLTERPKWPTAMELAFSKIGYATADGKR